MKKKKSKALLLSIGIVSLIVGFFVLLTMTSKETPVDQAINEAFSANEAKLVYLARPDCSWCQRTKPILERVAKEHDFKYIYINTGKLNSKELKSVLKKITVDINSFGTPTFVVVKNGKVVDYNIGFMNESKLTEFLRDAEVIK